MKKLLLTLSLVGWCSCSNGNLDMDRDRYLSVFGIAHLPQPQDKGAFLGRVVTEEGEPASGARVHIGKERAGITNTKGGFYIGDLDEGDYDVYLVSLNGNMIAMTVTIIAGEIIENEMIVLAGTIRVSGVVTLEGELIHEGSSVVVPGSPFSASTDTDGSYFIDVPQGKHKFRASARFLEYASQSTNELDVNEDLSLDIELERFPYPNGNISVTTDDDGFVRNRAVTLEIDAKPGVRYMKIESLGSYSEVENFPLDTWMPVKTEFKYLSNNFGVTRLRVWFQDGTGKISDLVHGGFFRTHFDRTWKIFTGSIDEDVVVEPNQKVAFVSQAGECLEIKMETDLGEAKPIQKPNQSSGELEDVNEPEPVNKKPSISRVKKTARKGSKLSNIYYCDSLSRGRSFGKGSDIGYRVEFTGTLTVKEGATLVGGATFRGPLILKGTKQNPIDWRLIDGKALEGETVIQMSGSVSTVEYVNFNYIYLWVGSVFGKNAVSFSDSTVSNSGFSIRTYNNNMSVSIDHSKFKNVYSYSRCEDDYIDDIPPDAEEDSDSTGTSQNEDEMESKTETGISFTSVEFENSRMEFSCEKSEGQIEPQKFKIEGSNFKLESPNYYIFDHWLSRHLNILAPGTEPSGDSDRQEVEISILNNYYQDPSKVSKFIDVEQWPTTIGPNLEARNEGAGVR